MNKKIITAVMVMMAGQAYAAEFSDLQAIKAAELRTTETGRIPAPEQPEPAENTQKGAAEIQSAVLKISNYSEKEFSGAFLNTKELADLTNQMNYIAGLPARDIPVQLLGYLEGMSVTLQYQLPRGPVGRDVSPAMKAARAMQAKVTSVKQPDKALRGSLTFAVGNVSLKLAPLNFTPAAVDASLTCRFEDGSGSVGARPEQELPVRVSGTGNLYQVEISAGKLSKFSLFTAPKSCQYVLNVRSVSGVSGSVTLAGSAFNMTREELSELLSDTRLNEAISAQNQPLRLMERNGFIVSVK